VKAKFLVQNPEKRGREKWCGCDCNAEWFSSYVTTPSQLNVLYITASPD